MLNCLVFSTPQSFWVDHADDLRNSSRFNTWLGYGPDWSCTSWVDVSDAVCRKHDVGYASLQGFAGATSTAEESNEMDEAWNPRNKHLADAVALADIVQHDCQTPSVFAQLIACLSTAGVTAGILHWGVNKINTKTWPYTEHDIAHRSSFPRYVRCEPPKVKNISLTQQRGRTYSVSWTYDPGCVSDITVDYYRLCWEVEVPNLLGLAGTRIQKYCDTTDGPASSSTIELPVAVLRWRSVTVSIEIRPNDVAYGGFFGFEDLLGNPWLDDTFFLGVFYDKQCPESKVVN